MMSKDIIERLDGELESQYRIHGVKGVSHYIAEQNVQDAKAEILSLRQQLKDRDAEIAVYVEGSRNVHLELKRLSLIQMERE